MARTSRSRTGCWTCRKRKKKCDELLYPVCQNCQLKKLACEWPRLKHELFIKEREAKYVKEKPEVHKHNDNSNELNIIRQDSPTSFSPPSQSKMSNYLQKIAMQEDIDTNQYMKNRLLSLQPSSGPLRSIQLQGVTESLDRPESEYTPFYFEEVLSSDLKNSNGKKSLVNP